MKYNKAQAKKLQAAVDKDVAKEADSLKEASSAEERAASIRATITQLTATKAEEETKLDEIMVNLQEGTAEYRKQLEAKQGELIVIQRSVAELKTEKEGVYTSLELANRSNTKPILLSVLQPSKPFKNVRVPLIS